MIQKPQGYDEAQTFTGEYEQVTLGGHICRIVQANVEAKNGRQMLVILFDIDEGGAFDGYYQKQYEERRRKSSDAKWGGTIYQYVDGSGTPFFKGIISSIEESNAGYTWNWDEKTLVGLYFGGNFGREQYEYDGVKKWTTKCMHVRTVSAVKQGIDPPKDKYLPEKNGVTAAPTAPRDFIDITPDEDLPF